MALKFIAKRPDLVDALTDAGIGSAATLAREAEIAPGTAQAIFRSDPVSLNSAMAVIRMLRAKGSEVATSTVFEEKIA